MLTTSQFSQALWSAIKAGPDDLAKDDDRAAFIEAVAQACSVC
jgi:hypothetical protein